MTKYNVHIYREMRLTFDGIEADTPEAAAAIARDKPTGDADDIDDCDGENLAALVDVAGDEDYEPIRHHRLRARAAHARPPRSCWRRWKRDPAVCRERGVRLDEAQGSRRPNAEAERAWEAIDQAHAAIAEAEAAGITPAPAELDIHALLAERRQIAAIWSIEDVQAGPPRPDRRASVGGAATGRATARRRIGINWDVLECHADMLYGDAPMPTKRRRHSHGHRHRPLPPLPRRRRHRPVPVPPAECLNCLAVPVLHAYRPARGGRSPHRPRHATGPAARIRGPQGRAGADRLSPGRPPAVPERCPCPPQGRLHGDLSRLRRHGEDTRLTARRFLLPSTVKY